MLDSFEYVPDHDQQLHREGAIRLLTGVFSSHENGLPEWVKNSAAAYVRERCEENRVVVLFFNDARPGLPSVVACMDFVGMTSSDILDDFRIWADPEAATRDFDDAELIGELGGHGTGAKSYMTQMFEDFSFFYTVRDGKGCKYGVRAGTYDFGFSPNPEEGQDFEVQDVLGEIKKALTLINVNLDSLADPIVNCASLAKGFSLVIGVGPKGYGDRRIPVSNLVDSILTHHQMIRSLDICDVYVIKNGRAFNNGRPLRLPEIQPMQGYEEPRSFPIPEILLDPATLDEVQTISSGSSQGELVLHTSERYLSRSREGRRHQHRIVYSTSSGGFFGYKGMWDFGVHSSFVDKIYGYCSLDSLEPYKSINRGNLVDSTLTRAVEDWIGEQIQNFTRELEEQQRRTFHQSEKSEASQMNEWLDQWKNRFLSEMMQGLYGPGLGTSVIERAPLPSGKPSRLDLTLSHRRAGVGVFFRPTLKFFDSGNRRIRPVPFRWVSEDTNVAIVHEDQMLLETFHFGETEIYAETLDGGFRSNKIPLEVVHIHEVRIIPSEIDMPAGTREKLEAICKLSTGEETSDVYLTWMENNSDIARVSSSGLVYSFSPGETEVVASDERCRSETPARIKVVPSEGRGEGSDRGRGYPKILLSEIDSDPDDGTEVIFSSDIPPVWQRTPDVNRNIWWINTASPFAKLFLDTSAGYGTGSLAWRMYLLERHIDVIIQIAMVHGPEASEDISPEMWISQCGSLEAEIRQGALESLQTFIVEGAFS